jgi:hypothetical protein
MATKVALCKDMVRPRIVENPSSKGDGSFYEVVTGTLFNEPVCDCPGYNFRGRCRHIAEAEETRCHFNRRLSAGERPQAHGAEIGKCPGCDGPLIIFDFTPEFV